MFAGTWSGILVDAKCYQEARSNVNPTDTSLADQDLNGQVADCRPKVKTKSFAVVQPDWTALNLDAAGSAKAATLVRSNTKKFPLYVTVTGERHKNEIAATALSLK